MPDCSTWTSARSAKKKIDHCVHRGAYNKVNKHGNNAKSYWNTRLSYFFPHISLNSWSIQLHKVQTVWMAKNNTLRLLNLTIISYSGRMAQWYEVLPIALEEVGLQVYITAGLLPVFLFCFFFAFFFHRIFTLWLVWLIMAVSGTEMLGVASVSRRAGIPSSPVPFDVLSRLSWRCTNAADSGFKENKDWLKLKFKHASVLSWFLLRGGMLKSNFPTTFVKSVQKPFAIVRASVVVFPSTVIGSIEDDGWDVTDLLGRTFLTAFQLFFPYKSF